MMNSDESTGASYTVTCLVLARNWWENMKNILFNEVLQFLLSDTNKIFLLQRWEKGLKNPTTLFNVKQPSTQHSFTPYFGGRL